MALQVVGKEEIVITAKEVFGGSDIQGGGSVMNEETRREKRKRLLEGMGKLG